MRRPAFFLTLHPIQTSKRKPSSVRSSPPASPQIWSKFSIYAQIFFSPLFCFTLSLAPSSSPEGSPRQVISGQRGPFPTSVGPHLFEWRLPPGSGWAQDRGPHRLASRVSTRGARVWERVRRGQRSFRALLPPRLIPYTGVDPDPTPKLGTTTAKQQQQNNKKTHEKEKKHNNIQVPPPPPRGMPHEIPQPYSFFLCRSNCASAPDFFGVRGCPEAFLPLTQEKQTEVNAPSYRRSSSQPEPSHLSPRGPELKPDRAGPFILGMKPPLDPDPLPRHNAGKAPGSSLGRYWGLGGGGVKVREGKV